MPPVIAPMIGMMTSPTSEFTMPENAAPMITPMARSTTFPRKANFLNSSSMVVPSPLRHGRACPGHPRLPYFKTWMPRHKAGHDREKPKLINQARVHHGPVHGGLRLLACRHHRQPYSVGAFADQRHCILDRRRARFNEQVDMKWRELVLQLQRRREVALQASRLELGAEARRDVRRHRDTAMPAVSHEAERGDVFAG